MVSIDHSPSNLAREKAQPQAQAPPELSIGQLGVNFLPDQHTTPSQGISNYTSPRSSFLGPKVPPREPLSTGIENGAADTLSEPIQERDGEMASLTISSPSLLFSCCDFSPSEARVPSLNDQQLDKKRELTGSAVIETSLFVSGTSGHEISPDTTHVEMVKSRSANTTRLFESTPEAQLLTPSIAPIRRAISKSVLPTLSPISAPSFSSKEIIVQGPSSLRDPLELVVRTRFLYDHQTREERINPVLLANLSLSCLRGNGISEEPALSAERLICDVMKGPRFASLIRNFGLLRPSLVNFVSQRRTLVDDKIRHLREDYVKIQEKWRSHCHKLDEQTKPSILKGETLPIGRATRRIVNLGDTVRSDLEMEQILASLESSDLSDPHYLSQHNLATIPDMISVKNGKVDYLFDDTCHRVENPAEYYAPEAGIHDWTEEEKKIFLDKYAAYPKQFGIIANCLPNKTSSQCVDYYYLHKKGLIDFRKVVSKFSSKRRRRGAGKRKGNALLTDIQKHDEEVYRDVGSNSISAPPLVSGRRGRKGREKEKEKGKGKGKDDKERGRMKEKEEKEREIEQEQEQENTEEREKEKTKGKEEDIKEKEEKALEEEEKASAEVKPDSERKVSARASNKRNAAQTQDKLSTDTPTPEPESKGRRKRVVAISSIVPIGETLSLNYGATEDTVVSSFSLDCPCVIHHAAADKELESRPAKRQKRVRKIKSAAIVADDSPSTEPEIKSLARASISLPTGTRVSSETFAQDKSRWPSQSIVIPS